MRLLCRLAAWAVFFATFVATTDLAIAGGKENQRGSNEAASYSIVDLMASVVHRGGGVPWGSMSSPSFSFDGGAILSSTNASGIYNAYAVPVDGGEALALTSSTTDAVLAVGYFPRDDRFLYVSDQGGNELSHVYVREEDGSVRDLTPGDRLRAKFVHWASDGESFFVLTNERDPRLFDLYEIAVDGYDRKMIFQDDKGHDIVAVSPDRQTVAMYIFASNANRDVYFYHRESGEVSLVTPAEGDIVSNPQTFSPDGAAFYYTTNEGHEFQYLVRLDLGTGERTIIKKVDWDIWRVRFSRGGKYLLLNVLEDARNTLYALDAATHEDVKLPDFPQGEITGYSLSADDRQIAAVVTSGRIPSDLYVADMLGGDPRRLTRSLSPAISADDLVNGEVVRFASFDDLEIPGVLYKPHEATPDRKMPALVWVHGGPGGVSTVRYDPLIQYLVNHGYVVYAINNRGSEGYGKTFFGLDDRDHGGGDLRDVVWSKRMLEATGYVDPERIGVMGASYGGFMVLAALTFAPEEFAVGVDIFGVSNWHRTVNNIPPWWTWKARALEEEIGDFSDAEYFRSISPLFHAGNIIRPLIVLQGANDVRVLKEESEEIVAAVRENGVPVEYVVFEDEGHGFRKRANEIHAYETILKFLDLYLAK